MAAYSEVVVDEAQVDQEEHVVIDFDPDCSMSKMEFSYKCNSDVK